MISKECFRESHFCEFFFFIYFFNFFFSLEISHQWQFFFDQKQWPIHRDSLLALRKLHNFEMKNIKRQLPHQNCLHGKISICKMKEKLLKIKTTTSTRLRPIEVTWRSTFRSRNQIKQSTRTVTGDLRENLHDRFFIFLLFDFIVLDQIGRNGENELWCFYFYFLFFLFSKKKKEKNLNKIIENVGKLNRIEWPQLQRHTCWKCLSLIWIFRIFCFSFFIIFFHFFREETKPFDEEQ